MRAVGREDEAWIARVRVPTLSLSLSLRQLSQMLQAGVHLLRALEALTQQPESPDLAEIWWTVQGMVNRGAPLSQALSPFKATFSRAILHQIRVGEATGSLVAVLARLAESLEREDLLRRRVLSALAYPLVVLLVSGLVSFGLLRFVLPPFLDSLQALKLQLPWPTRLLMSLSNALRYPWIPLLLGLGILWQRNRLIQAARHSPKTYQVCSQLPLLGRCMRNYATIRLARAAAQLISAGGEALRSWELALRASGDPRLEALWPQFRQHLLEGEDPSSFFRSHGQLVSPLFAALLEVGEQTGKTSVLLERIARSLEDDLDHELGLLTALLQPFLLALVSLSTLFVILALFLPLYSQLMNL